MTAKKILIVDDHPLMRTALRITLEDTGGLDVVGEAGTLQEGRQKALVLKPDLIVLDLYLPDGSGLDLIYFRNEQLPKSRILVLTSSKIEKDIITVMEAGADSYMVKDSLPEQLLQAVQTVLAGESFLTPGATSILLKHLRQPEREADEKQSNATSAVVDEGKGRNKGPVDLSERERQILHHLAGGASSVEIAQTLHISDSTLRTHFQHILKKLGLQNRSQAVIYAVKNQI